MSRAARAPGKVVLTGAYAVLHGAPALVAAVSRGAVANGERSAPPSREVAAALGPGLAPVVDVSELFDGERKLGLGASAAALVATLGLVALERGEGLAQLSVKNDIFAKARAAHALAQSGGSGVDVAASVFGGTLAYTLVEGRAPAIDPVELPDVSVSVYASTTSARTTELRGKVDAFAERAPSEHARVMGSLSGASTRAYAACRAADTSAFLQAARDFAEALGELGAASAAPIFGENEAALCRLASHRGLAFFPSGAGGGDVSVLLAPSRGDIAAFDAEARARGLTPLGVAIDRHGVRDVSLPATDSRLDFSSDLLRSSTERPSP
jgi:phosphomevalonate kinase